MDKLVGGPGLRRGRRDPDNIEYGEALDFWRVIGIQQNPSLTLRAEMKLPGTAILDYQLNTPSNVSNGSTDSADSPTTSMTMTARFRPKGILGILYWYSVLPFHGIVFKGMLKGIKRNAEQLST